ncbi:MAG TPA: dipeptidase [Planctomycetota bacterium]|nr:dipeptidase [Planctomycetota bacterium]
MKVFDFHSDLLSRLLEEPFEGFEKGRGEGECRQYTLERLKAGGVRAVVWALYTENERGEHPVVRTLRMIDIAHRLAERHADALALARTAAEVEAAGAAGKCAAILSIENGVACLDRLELLRTYHRLGVRAMGLVWNGRNAIADGCGEEAAGSKLTSFGRQVLDEMNRLGMLVDVSHLSVAGFWDVAERQAAARRPFIASHSNARALCDHRRNLDDEQIRAVARSGGVIGVNFYPSFIRAGGEGASIDDVVAHALALAEKAGGIEHVGIGADFDGISYGPRGLEDPSRYPALAAALAARGLSDADLEKVFFGNFLRVFRSVCG